MTKIKHLSNLEILDSRGNPTVMATIHLDNGQTASACVPSGASTGVHEALELRDQDPKRYHGLGVIRALNQINDVIAPALTNKDVRDQRKIDQIMLDLDGTADKSRLGANAILAVSLAACKAAALSENLPLYRYIAQLFNRANEPMTLPVPMMNVLNGGKHALKASDMQEYMIMPHGLNNFPAIIQAGSEIFHTLGKILKKQNLATTVGDEGGYAPSLSSNQAPLDLMIEAITQANYQPGKEVSIALDPAASEFFDSQSNTYGLKAENRHLNAIEMVKMYHEWAEKYPLISLEDGLAEDDWEGWHLLQQTLGQKIQIVGDDLLVTNIKRLQMAIEKQACNSILIKVNQIGTLSETIAAIELAHAHHYTAVISHRSGETEDTFIADLAVGSGAGQIKTGSMSRSERIAKYNRLLQINQELGDRALVYQLPWLK